jgi:predicted ATPase/DNA-binding SARP family transcriptional activator/Tfp pilus assembly protein PilF
MVNARTNVTASSLAQPPQLRIHLLGPMQIERDGEQIHLPRRKVESLLAYLLLHPERHTRDHLATLLWGDSSDAQARHSLRTALATVRQQVSADLLLTARDHVQLNPNFPMWVDLYHLLDMEQGFDYGAHNYGDHDLLQAHLALWRGELLEGLYDEWVTLERGHYQSRLIRLFLQVTQALRAHSEYAQAIGVAQRVLQVDPANEHAHQHLMFCFVASGNRPAALHQFELCKQALTQELDASPSPETTALYQWIKQFESDSRSAASQITNLPIPLSSFVGRTSETAQIKRLLLPSTKHPVRLLTLTGAGGSGKTRLAIQAATDLIDRYEHGVWWVELAALNDGMLVARAVAKSLGVNEVAGQPLSQSIASSIGDKAMLLVIDNCEHLLEACASLATELLAHCSRLQILATSREALNIAGEMLWQVPTFAVPDPAKTGMLDGLLAFESVRLFIERATAIQPSFALTYENAQAIAQICHQLDGIPLAIELAAARVKVLSVEQIATYLARALGARFELLTQGSRVALPRHQTLRATIDWSYNLLDEAERTLFRRLSVFRGGFTLETIEQIVLPEMHEQGHEGEVGESSSPTLLELLTQLVDKSLVIAEPQGEEKRYRLLETLREYAQERFSTPDELAALQQRHATFFLQMAEQAATELLGIRQHSWLIQLELEHPNLRVALDYLIAKEDGENALRLASALYYFWDSRGYMSEGRQWLNKALALRALVQEETRAKALSAVGLLAYHQDDYPTAEQALHESLMLYEHVEDDAGIAEALRHLGSVESRQGRYEVAQRHLEQSLELFRQLKHSDGTAAALNNLGNLAWELGKNDAARAYFLESLEIRQRMGDQAGIATVLFNLGNTTRVQGDYAAAKTYYEECLRVGRNIGHAALIGIALKSLGVVAYHQQDYDKARRYGEESLQLLLEIGDKSNAGFALSNLGYVARKLGENNEALVYFQQSLQLMHELGHIRGIFFAMEAIAGLLLDLDQHSQATVHLLSANLHLRQQAGIPVPAADQAEYEEVSAKLRQLLGDEAFDALWREGETEPIERIVAEATSLSLDQISGLPFR